MLIIVFLFLIEFDPGWSINCYVCLSTDIVGGKEPESNPLLSCHDIKIRDWLMSNNWLKGKFKNEYLDMDSVNATVFELGSCLTVQLLNSDDVYMKGCTLTNGCDEDLEKWAKSINTGFSDKSCHLLCRNNTEKYSPDDDEDDCDGLCETDLFSSGNYFKPLLLTVSALSTLTTITSTLCKD